MDEFNSDLNKILSEIDNYKKENKIILTLEFQKKIPELLSYLQNDNLKIENKIKIFNFIDFIIEEVEFNIDIINNFISNNSNEPLSLYKILIKEYFYSTNKDYKEIIFNILKKFINNTNCDINIFDYLFSFIVYYMNIYDNNLNLDSENKKLPPELLFNFLELIECFYTKRNNIEGKNYFFFTGNSELIIKNNNNILNLKDNKEINLLINFELILNPTENNYLIEDKSTLIDIKFENENNLSFFINKENKIICLKNNENLTILRKNEINCFLLKLKNKGNVIEIEVYINNFEIQFIKKIEIPKLEIKQITFFKNFIGICTSIIFYKNDLSNDCIKVFKKEENINGIYNEDLFSKFISNFEENLSSNLSDKNERLTNKLISIYIPTRIEIINKNKYIIRDTINYLDAEFINNNLYLKSYHLCDLKFDNYLNTGKLNILLPILEFMSNNNEIISHDNFNQFFLILINVFNIKNIKNILDDSQINFFTNVNLFLQNIPNSFFDKLSRKYFEILSNKIIILCKELKKNSKEEFNKMLNISKIYHNKIIFNDKILSKFSSENQIAIIDYLLSIIDKHEKLIKISLSSIILIILIFDDESKSKFCCKKHALYFKEENILNIIKLGIKSKLERIGKIINIFFDDYFLNKNNINKKERIKTICKLLILPISPCLQNFIILIFKEFIKKIKENKNLINTFNIIDLFNISLYAFKNSLFDVKINLYDLIIDLLNLSKTKDINENLVNHFIENNIIPNYQIISFEKKENNENEINELNQQLNNNKVIYDDIDIEYSKVINNTSFYKNLNDFIMTLNSEIERCNKISFHFPILLKVFPYFEIVYINMTIQTINEVLYLNDNEKIFFTKDFLHLNLEICLQIFLYQNIKDYNILINLNNFQIHSSKNLIEILSNGKKIIKEILLDNIEQFDYLLIWGKYYYSLFLENSILLENLMKFINLILDDIINSINIKGGDANFIYIFGIIFQIFTLLKFNFNVNINNNNEKKLEYFIQNLYSISKDKKLENEIPISKSWNGYKILQIIFSYTYQVQFNEIENDYLKNFDFIILKKTKENEYMNLLKILFYDFKDYKVKNSIQLIFIIFHYLILLLCESRTENDIKKATSNVKQYIIVLICISCGIEKNDNEYKKYNSSFIQSIIYFSISILIDQIHKRTNFKYVNYYHLCLGQILKICFKIYQIGNSKDFSKNTKDDLTLSNAFILFNEFFNSVKSLSINNKIIKNILEKKENYENDVIELINNNEFISFFYENKEKQNIVLKEIIPFLDFIDSWENEVKTIIPCYDNRLYGIQPKINICLNPYHKKKCLYKENLNNLIEKYNRELLFELKLLKIKRKFKEKKSLKFYYSIKKNLFSFNNIYSNKEYFYNKKKYKLLYKNKNYLTEEYTRILITPILDFESYIPKFYKFQEKNLFYNSINSEIKTIYKITNLNYKKKKKQKIENNNIIYKLSNKIYSKIPKVILNMDIIAKNFIEKEKLSDNYSYNLHSKGCIIFHNYHIRGIFYLNSKEIGFYSFLLNYNKDDIDYDKDRQTCFGSVFLPQTSKIKYYHLIIKYNEIKYIFKRRYLYRRNSIEIFTTNQKSYLFQLENYEQFITYINKNSKLYLEEINIEFTQYFNPLGYYNKNNHFSGLTEEKSNYNLLKIYENWKNYKISTLQLIMTLNIYSNRTYNDIHQYPIFPWIYIKYDNTNFEINKENIRPFNLPMGMMDFNEIAKERKNQYISNWNSDKDNGDDCRYGTHYSCGLYVTYYLIRTFPFSFDRIELYGSDFDNPNRLFNNLETSFNLVISQKSDVRELIPELFCFPELFYNNNNLNFGQIKNKLNDKLENINNVVLPKWCSNNGYYFIYYHRLCLESEEVSLYINNWFDLIFGVYQNGEKAKKIYNLFQVHCYEDYENEFNKESEFQKQFDCRKYEFGVNPNQIFKNLTSARNTLCDFESKNSRFQIINSDLEKEIISITDFSKFKYINDIDFQYLQIIEIDNKFKLYFIYFNFILSYDIYSKKDKKEMNYYYYLENEVKYILIQNKNRMKNINKKKVPLIIFGKGEFIVIGGCWNGNIIVQKSTKENNNIEHNIYDHSNYPINNIVIDKYDHFAICSNLKGKIIIYQIENKEKIKWFLFKIIQNCYTEIININLCEKLNIVMTYSKDNFCMIYTFPIFQLVNSFKVYNDDFEEIYSNKSFISYSPLPSYLFYSKEKNLLLVYSINGEKVKEMKINEISNIRIFTDNLCRDYILFIDKENNFQILNLPLLKNIFFQDFEKDNNLIDINISEDKSFICFFIKNKLKNFEIKILKNKKTKI